MGNICFTRKKTRYIYIAHNHQWSISSYDSYQNQKYTMLLSCKICNEQINVHSVIAKCIECNGIIGHANCIDQDKVCILCLQ